MKKTSLPVLIGVAVLAVLGDARAAEPAGAADPAKWQLVWGDEFNYTGLPDPKKWDYEEGFVRNNEPQWYTRGRLENARVEHGTLIIAARQEPFKNPSFQPGATRPGKPQRAAADYTSASLITQHRASWQYGRLELRAKLPQGLDTWPAFWTLGINHQTAGWPACGEIDIMEYWARRPHEMTATVHWRRDGKHQQDHGKLEVPESLGEFHVYALEWNAERMDFFCDGKKYHTVPLAKLDDQGDNAFRKPHYILLNLALEGRGRKIDGAALPQQFIVDYVRVYAPK
ncbi:MAG: glycoside hydrolase family 16 protein [Kiritimatiellaeota bacterium]|nr:glycoside hydrolase family 16 protein [Kiritimatiellota bacterium]